MGIDFSQAVRQNPGGVHSWSGEHFGQTRFERTIRTTLMTETCSEKEMKDDVVAGNAKRKVDCVAPQVMYATIAQVKMHVVRCTKIRALRACLRKKYAVCLPMNVSRRAHLSLSKAGLEAQISHGAAFKKTKSFLRHQSWLLRCRT